MKTVFITGSSGFVGGYLRQELVDNGYKVVGSDLRTGNAEYIMDVTKYEDVERVLAEVLPDYIIHLAGFASVKASFDNPELCMKINVEGTRNVMDAIVKVCPDSKVLIISSADTYADSENKKITEDMPQKAKSPYGESRIAQEKLVQTYTNVNWVISRSFPHIGPGQPQGYVTADFASQIAEINKNKISNAKIGVGNLEGIRDFTDVRDTVVAYRLLLEKGQSREVYNVCSGKEIEVHVVLDILLALSSVKIDVFLDQSKLRPLDVKYNVGNNYRLVQSTGWQTKIPFETTMKDIYNYWLNNNEITR